MRRALVAVTLGGLLLSTTACDSDAQDTSARPVLVTPSATPTTSPAPDYSADTEKVCGKVTTIFSKDLAGFSTAMGKMIANKEAKQADEAEQAEKAAAAQLKTLGTKLRKETSTAEDPDLRTAGAASAAKLTRSAADARFFDSIKAEKDLNNKIEDKMSEWMSPVIGYCA